MSRRSIHSLLVSGLVLVLSGCHLDMYDQPKYAPLTSNVFSSDSSSARPLPEGVVARGHARTDELLYTGRIQGKFSALFPFPVTEQVLRRGQDRFNTFCSPCHGRLGDGNGMIVQRRFPRPRSFHNDTLRAEPPGYYFDVITNGFGRMYSYAASVKPEDRWAIIAYIRALQLSRRVPVGTLSPDERALLTRSNH
ncbi:MAG: cytochrome c [Ignavibacterium sp.]